MSPHPLTRYAGVFSLALACAGFPLLSVATSATTYDVAAAQKARSEIQALVAAGRAAAAGGAQPAEAFANVERAYPPSCLESPISLGLYVNNPSAFNVQQAQIRFYGDPIGDATEQAFSEVDTVTLFRLVCSGGKSASLLEIDRPGGHSTTLYPIFPNVSVAQGSNNLYIRLADDPNTFFATNFAFSPLVDSNVYTLENFYGGAEQFDYNQAYALTVDNLNSNDSARLTTFNMPNYIPSPNPPLLPINGYMSTNWSNPNQSGEGIVLQVYDNGDQATRTLAFAWFTYDNQGFPFWLFGSASLNIGATSVTAQTAYLKGGTFAPPSASPGVPVTLWGTVTFSFPDCGHMHIQYNGDASVIGGPKGNSSATFSRVADVNGLVCQ
jgi:hypothetical protein